MKNDAWVNLIWHTRKALLSFDAVRIPAWYKRIVHKLWDSVWWDWDAQCILSIPFTTIILPGPPGVSTVQLELHLTCFGDADSLTEKRVQTGNKSVYDLFMHSWQIKDRSMS